MISASTRQQRGYIKQITSTRKAIRMLLDCYTKGNKHECITLLNSYDARHILAEIAPWIDTNIYNEALSNVPVEDRPYIRLAKIWQALKQTCRLFLPGDDHEIDIEVMHRIDKFVKNIDDLKIK